MYRPHPQHLAQFSYVGNYRYSLRFCTDHRSRVFVADAPVALVLSQIRRVLTETGLALIAYCFMPDHVHLLIEGETDASDCRQFIARAKQSAGSHERCVSKSG